MDMNIKMPKGYRLLANHKNEVVLAEAENKEVPEPYVTWLVSNGSDTHTGTYFTDLKQAEINFCETAFKFPILTKKRLLEIVGVDEKSLIVKSSKTKLIEKIINVCV